MTHHIKVNGVTYANEELSTALATVKAWDALSASVRHDHITDKTVEWAEWDAAVMLLETFQGNV